MGSDCGRSEHAERLLREAHQPLLVLPLLFILGARQFDPDLAREFEPGQMRHLDDPHELRGRLVGARRAVSGRCRELVGTDAHPHAIAAEVAGKIRSGQLEPGHPQAAEVELRVQLQDVGRKQVENAEQPRHLDAGRAFGDGARRAALHQPALAQDQHFVAQLEALLQIVCHQHGGDLKLGADLPQQAIELAAEGRVQAAGRLIEQQQPGSADQRAGDRAALFLAAGELVRPPAGGVGQMKALEHLIHLAVPLQAGTAFGREGQVLPQRHVRKQRVVLEHVAAVARPGGQVHARGRVEQDLVVEQDAAFLRHGEAGDRVERQGFPGAARPEQHRDAGAGAELDIQGEGGRIRPGREPFADAQFEHYEACLATSRLASDRISTASTETITTRVRASAPLPDSTAS